MQNRGLLTLDIDGTLTDTSHQIPEPVIDYLSYLYDEGWEIAFITGRTYSYAKHSITPINFPFYLCVQNGADILSAEERRVVSQSYISKKTLTDIVSKMSDGMPDPFIYAGFERGDFCYYRPDLLSKEVIKYTQKLMTLCGAPWVSLAQFSDITQQGVPLVKFYGKYEQLLEFEKKLESVPHLSVCSILDPVDPRYHICLITHERANKGMAAQSVKDLLGIKGPHIAAGDDRNDIPMLKTADRAIVMKTAPIEMHDIASVIAEPAAECGIIDALSTVIQELSGELP